MVAFEDYVLQMAADVDDFARHPGSRERRSKAHVSWRGRDAPASPAATSSRRADTHISFPEPRPRTIFPQQLLEVLSDPSSVGIIEWLVHGHAFAIKDPSRFAKDIMPRFTRGKLTSFQRQLNLYGFRKVTKGTDCQAGALVYFHPAFKRGRPEMMEGIKRIACKGQCSLNRLRNEEVPYDPSVFSEETDAPEQDVNSLDVGTRKRSSTWPGERFASKRMRTSPHIQENACAATPRRVHEDLWRTPPIVENATLFSEIKPDILTAGLDAILEPDMTVHPAAPPAIDLGDLPLFHGTSFNTSAGATEELQFVSGTRAPAPASVEEEYAFAEISGVLSTSACVMKPCYSRRFTESTPRRSSNAGSPERYESPPLPFQTDDSPLTDDVSYYAAEQFTMPPPKSNFVEAAVEDRLPLPSQRSDGGAGERVRPTLHFAKRFGERVGPMSSEPLMRNVSEVSGLSNASDLWRGCDELGKDIDFAGLFD